MPNEPPVFDRVCPWCKRRADLEVFGVISFNARCACGAIALGTYPRDWDDAVDDAVNYFKLPRGRSSFGLDPQLLRERGIEMIEGGRSMHPTRGEPINWLWLRGPAEPSEPAPPTPRAQAPSAEEARLALLKKNAEAAYDRMYDDRRPQDGYHDAMELFGEAIVLARSLGRADEVTALEARREHVRAVYRSQFAR